MNPARMAAARAICKALQGPWPLMPIELQSEGLSIADRRLAMAITRGVAERLLTFEHLLGPLLRQPFDQLEPAMRAVLLSGTAQLMLLPRIPARAAVHESVDVARKLIRPKASGMVNAVLRRFSETVQAHDDVPWAMATDRLPGLSPSQSIRLANPVLPPVDDVAGHLAVAFSHPQEMVKAMLDRHGHETTIGLLSHCLVKPPVLLASSDRPSEAVAHERDGFWVWPDGVSTLGTYLEAHPAARVQDPASAMAVEATAERHYERIYDVCAGQGTKTRQLAALHRDAQIYASDSDSDRLKTLVKSTQGLPNVTVLPHGQKPKSCDLILLDVPCSNTGVMSRRPEARYRYNAMELERMIDLQQRIAEDALEASLAARGEILWSTCSLEPQENQRQTRWLASRFNRKVEAEHQQLPTGEGRTYHDGAYHALLVVSSE